MAPAQTDPNAAFESSSQPPSSGCCDDHLSPLYSLRARRRRRNGQNSAQYRALRLLAMLWKLVSKPRTSFAPLP
jgi:hypothetical protein